MFFCLSLLLLHLPHSDIAVVTANATAIANLSAVIAVGVLAAGAVCHSYWRCFVAVIAIGVVAFVITGKTFCC